ncbi:MAG TPA: HDOD domain-containing protein, partial [Bryobacteraceae bacterium]|nr:HDOD domain-containing protein [Bryobacteraceae bacterium]
MPATTTAAPVPETLPAPDLSRLAGRLPAFSPVALRLISIIGDENVPFKEVAKLIQVDPAISGEVLRLANSGFYGRRSTVRSILHAIGLLGVRRISTLVVTAALWNGLPKKSTPFVKAWWRHSIASALVAEYIRGAGEAADSAYTASLLHSIGQLAFYQYSPAIYESVVVDAVSQGANLVECERRAFGVDHAVLADWILRSWNVPVSIRESIGGHHSPCAGKSELDRILCYSCVAADLAGFGSCGSHWDQGQVPDALAKLIESEYVRE